MASDLLHHRARALVHRPVRDRLGADAVARGADGCPRCSEPRMSNSPIDDGFEMIERVFALLVETRMIYQRLEAMEPTDSGTEAERAVVASMLSSLQPALVRALEAVLAELKGGALAAQAEQWFKRLEGRSSG